MTKYTIYGEEVDNFIQKNYLNKIIESFVKDVNTNNKVISIILFGGFGKGEGSIQFIDNKPIPYNDFDFYIVTKRKLTDKELNKISMNASNAINMGGLEIAYHPEQGYDSNNFFHIDVRCIPYNYLNKLIKTQRYYELKYGSQVIYGDKFVLDKIPEIRQEEIPLSDGLRNLFNKLHTMLLGLNKEYNEDQRKIKIFWSYKCYLSICESLLILDRKFAPTSVERVNIFINTYKKSFPDLYEKIPNLREKVRKATKLKLKLDFNVDTEIFSEKISVSETSQKQEVPDHEKLWKEALKDILIVFEYYLKRIADAKNSEGDIEYIIKNKLPYTYFKPYLRERIGFNFFPSQYLLNLGYFNVLIHHNEFYLNPLFSWKDVGLRMILPIYFLLKTRQEINQETKNSNNSDYLNKAYNELKNLIRVNNKDFWHLRERALKAFGLYYQQRLL